MSFDVQELSSLEALEEYREDWNRLLAQTPQAHFFQSWEWLVAYWTYFQRDQQLRVLVHLEGGRPVGVVPMVLQWEKTRIGRVRVLTYPLEEWGPVYGPVGPHPTKTLQAALEYLRQREPDWDLLELRWVSPEDDRQGGSRQAMQWAGFPPIRTLWNSCAVVELGEGEAGWHRYLAHRSAKWRANLRKAEKKLAALGPVEYVRYRPEGEWTGQIDPRWDLYEACYQIAQRSWQARSQTGTTLCHPEVRQFLRHVHLAATRLGAVDMNLLYVKGQPVAFAYNYVWQGHVYGLRRGFDPQWAPYSVGNLLLARAIRDSFLRNDRLYNLGTGYLQSKRAWMSRLMPTYRYSYFASHRPRLMLLRWKRQWQARHCPPAC